MKARALMSFSGYGISAENGQVIDIQDEKVFLDLAAARFVEQVDRVSHDGISAKEAEAKLEEKQEAKLAQAKKESK